MSLNDPISDMLNRIRNAITARQNTVQIPASRLKTQLADVLKREGFIEDYRVEQGPQCDLLLLTLKYARDKTNVIQGLQRVSKPSLRVYVRSDEVRPVRSGLGVSVLSTSRGVMTGKEARNQGVGGEVLCEVW